MLSFQTTKEGHSFDIVTTQDSITIDITVDNKIDKQRLPYTPHTATNLYTYKFPIPPEADTYLDGLLTRTINYSVNKDEGALIHIHGDVIIEGTYCRLTYEDKVLYVGQFEDNDMIHTFTDYICDRDISLIDIEATFKLRGMDSFKAVQDV